MGSVYQRKNKLWINFKGPDGKREQWTTPFRPGQEKEAKALVDTIEKFIAEGKDLGDIDLGPITVEKYVQRWIRRREARGVADWHNDEGRMKKWVIPSIGGMRLAEVRPRHLVTLIDSLRSSTSLAPKTVYNIYSNLKALFRDAEIDELIDRNPCILTKFQLGPNVDKDPEWRDTAIFTRIEAERLISDPLIPEDRQVLYALQSIAMLRHGEAAGLTFRNYDATIEPLGRLTIATSYDKGRTKTGKPRAVPVHPTLAAILAEWKLKGWPEMMGRQPTSDDLIVPLPEGRRAKAGDMRRKHHTYKRWKKDLEALGLRHRRGHDLRRTGITLARQDGAQPDRLERCTHNVEKGHSTIDVYTAFMWENLCEEINKMRISRRTDKEVVALPVAVGQGQNPSDLKEEKPKMGGSSATPAATPAIKHESLPVVKQWRRRESKAWSSVYANPSKTRTYLSLLENASI